MALKNYIRTVFASCFAVFVLNKFAFRPLILNADPPRFFLSIAYSLPNLIEAIMGTIAISAIFFAWRERPMSHLAQLKNSTLYLTATLVAAIYVLTQEFKIHNVGGNNVYDPNDVVASILGLIAVNLMLNRFGLIAQR